MLILQDLARFFPRSWKINIQKALSFVKKKTRHVNLIQRNLERKFSTKIEIALVEFYCSDSFRDR